MSVRSVFTFPNPVNDYAARSTAGLVVALAIVAIVVDHWALYALLAIGFALRVASGPSCRRSVSSRCGSSPPSSGARPSSFPDPEAVRPGIGLAFSTTALVLSLLGYGLAAQIVVGVLIVAATLEFALGFCLGCVVFGFLQRNGIIPDTVCEACNNISLRNPDLANTSR